MVGRIGGGGGGIDLSQFSEIKELENELAKIAVQGSETGAVEAPVINVPGGKGATGDRRGAQAMLMQRTGAVVPQAQTDTQLNAQEQQVADKMQSMGLLPKPPAEITRQMLDGASRQFIEKNLDNKSPSGDIDELFAKIESMMQQRNARSNPSPKQWSGQAPASRSGAMPPASTYANRGPAPNAGALQQQARAAVATVSPPPTPGSAQARIAEATQRYMGTSTAAGPDGGNLACAWSVNNILRNAGVPTVGTNTNYVPSVEQALQGGRGTAIDASQARPGDIVIWPNGHHIGIAMGNNQVANNSSSRASFSNMSQLPPGCRVYRLNDA